jgi:hypothetical protein
MERVLDVAEQVVNVFASDDQTPLLGLVQLPRMPRTLRCELRHNSSKYFNFEESFSQMGGFR